MRVKIVTDVNPSEFEDKINKVISDNRNSDVEIKYSTCTKPNSYVFYSAILIIVPKKPKNII